MTVSKMEDFIRLSTRHAAKCGKELVLVERDTKRGCFIRETWKCPCCGNGLTFDNCDMVRSEEVAMGASHSRSQPDFNLRIIKGARLVGVNVKQLQEFLEGEMGIKIPTDKNIRAMGTKVGASITTTYSGRKAENQMEHVAAVRAADDYDGDIEWEDGNGVAHSTSRGNICADGGYCTRTYNQNNRGRNSVVNCMSNVTGKPIGLATSVVRLSPSTLVSRQQL